MEDATHTNVIERLNEEFRRCVKTQGALPGEDAALLLLYSFVVTGQITLRKLDGHEKMCRGQERRQGGGGGGAENGGSVN